MFFKVIQQDYSDILSWPDLSDNPHVYARLNWPSSGFICVASLLLVHHFAEFVGQLKDWVLMTSEFNCNSELVTFMVF